MRPRALRHARAAAVLVTVISTGAVEAASVASADASAVRQPDDAAASSNPHVEVPARSIVLSMGTGQLIRLPRPITGMFIADDKVADVQVRSPTQLYLFGKGPGQTSIFATDKSGTVVWSSEVKVGNNIATIGAMLKAAMPDALITATPMGNMILLTGTVVSPKDIEEAERLTTFYTGGALPVMNRIKTATPMQVNLRVRIAEVNRDLVKQIGTNFLTRDTTGGFIFGVGRGTPGTISLGTTSGQALASGPYSMNYKSGLNTFGAAGHLLGLDILSTLDVGETNGLVNTLAEPNLTALSGESASFLAGGEIPIPVGQGLGQVSVEYKQYGVSLSFTPVVLANGRISLKVKPEVSDLAASAVTFNGYSIPAITTRRADTTVELGSGQSFMIAGLMKNNTNNATDKIPGVGSLPILGALFRSNTFRHQETELVIVVTPYLVEPVDAQRIVLPTDGYKSPNDVDRVLLGKSSGGTGAAASPAAGQQGGQ